MYNFTFQNTTKVYFGNNILENLGSELNNYGKNVLMVYSGSVIKEVGIYDKIMSHLNSANLTIFEYDGVEPNPRHTSVNEGSEICKKEGIDVVLAVGGGSVIDCCKGISVTSVYGGDSWDLVTKKATTPDGLPIIVVSTMAATGSEMNSGAMISNADTNQKLSLNHQSLAPKVTFLDPTNTISVPKFQTACGAFDIMSHVMDMYYFTNTKKLDMIDGVQEQIMRTVFKFAPIALNDPTNYDARANLMWAASWALNNFLTVGSTERATCHAIDHVLGGYYDITHGLGLAIITPRWLEYILDENTAPRIQKFGVNVFGISDSKSPIKGAKASIDALSNFLFNTLGLESKLSNIGIDESNFDNMAVDACRNGIINGFKTLSPDDVVNILRMCL